VFLHHILRIFILFSTRVVYSSRKREQRRVLAQEHKNLSRMFRNFILEFVKLKELIYERQALERDEQQH